MRLFRILHVIDDKKFESSCLETFAVEGVENTLCTGVNLKEELRKDSFDVLIVHFLRDSVIRTLYQDIPKVPLVWFFWGGDVFGMGKFYNTFLTTKARKARVETAFQNSLKSGIQNVIKDIVPSTVDWSSDMQMKREVMKHFDIIVPIIPQDYYLLQQVYPLKAKMWHLNYVSPSTSKKHFDCNSGQNILLGNSASFSNNHLDAVDMLSRVELTGRKVIIPLNYGNRNYAKLVSEYAKKKLGDKAITLIEFLPFEEYSTLIESCNVMIMNHFRQQALGNIVHAFMTGMRVNLPSRSPLFKFLTDEGFRFSNFDNDLFEIDTLPLQEQVSNRNLCIKVFGAETQHQRVKELVSMLKDIDANDRSK